MVELLTTSNITFSLGIMGLAFTIYKEFTGPQIKLEKSEGIFALKLSEIQKDFANLRDNHVHTLDTKIEETNKSLGVLTIQVTKLGTIIEERLPKRK